MHSDGTVMQNSSETIASETKSRLIWCGVVVGLLSLQILGCVVAAILATSSKSMAVLPDYHQKALQWDQLRAQQAEIEQLGWQAVVDVSPPMDVYRNRMLTVRIQKKNGKAVDVTDLEVTVYHHANANAQHVPDMEELAPGTFRGKVRLPKQGIWQLQAMVHAEGKQIEMSVEHRVKDAQ